MTVAQLTDQNSLRSIENAIKSDSDLYHVGIRTNLARANEKRPCTVFQNFYFHLLDHYKFLCGKKGCLEGKSLKLIDTTTITLNMNDFSWAKFRSMKSGIKINTRFGYYPLFLILRKTGDFEHGRQETFSRFCYEISVVFFFKHRDFNKWSSRIYKKVPSKTFV